MKARAGIPPIFIIKEVREMRWLLLLAALALVALALACEEEKAPTTVTPAPVREHSLGSASAPVTIIEYADFQ